MTADDRRCHATTRAGARCTQWAVRGATVCRMHGGGSPKVKRAAARRVAAAAAEATVQRTVAGRGPMTIGDVYRELLATGATVTAWRDLLTERLDDLNGQLTYTDALGVERVRADVQLFARALDQATKTLELIARLDLDARLVAITARQADVLDGIIRRVLAVAGLTPEQEAAALDALPALLQAAAKEDV